MTEGRDALPIMVVDDDFDVRQAMAAVLEDEGYPVILAADGHEALDLLRRGARPRLILLDLRMPVMDGETFCRQRRQHPDLGSIPVVIVSADRCALEKTRSYDVAELLMKPIDLLKLLEVVSHF